jgi:Ser-tRNA(Ala) deacylase AlaX
MALETFTIEIRVDHDDPVKLQAVTDLCRMHTKSLLASCMLLQDVRPPQVSLTSANMYEREKEIDLAEDLIPEEAK